MPANRTYYGLLLSGSAHLIRMILGCAVLLSAVALSNLPAFAAGGKKGGGEGWWNKAWSNRVEVLIDTSKEGFEIEEEIGAAPVLLRLVDGSFSFSDAAEDGGDLRFVAEDGTAVLPTHIEAFDPYSGEGFAWVSLEGIPPKSAKKIWLYYGAADTSDAPPTEADKRFDADTVLVYHFNDNGAAPVDASGNGNTATNAPVAVNGALIGGGARYTGSNPTIIPGSESLAWVEGQEFTFSAWAKPFTLAPESILFRRAEGDEGLVIGFNNGVPYAALSRGGSTLRTAAGEPVSAAGWHHIGLSAGAGAITLFVNGKEYAKIEGALPELTTQIEIGGSTAPGATGLSGEMDELSLSKVARPPGWFQFVAASQGGSEAARRLVRMGEPEQSGGAGGNETLEHIMLFGDIAANMMFDGWIAVGVCILMMIAGWSVAAKKTAYVGRIEKGNEAFLKEWQHVSSDLTVLDSEEDGKPPQVFERLSNKTLRLIKDSPLYHIYHVGAEEIRHRIGGGKNRGQGLSARSLQAIRAALDSSMVREQHRMSSGLVFLTISIAGGPYVGLLGTVVGVMITFALIAKTGDVEVNSIAPGIASALLATTVGLLVAIPALFLYSFLNSRIKKVNSNMQMFIDEFIAKVAEFYPPPGEVSPSSPKGIDPSLGSFFPNTPEAAPAPNGKSDLEPTAQSEVPSKPQQVSYGVSSPRAVPVPAPSHQPSQSSGAIASPASELAPAHPTLPPLVSSEAAVQASSPRKAPSPTAPQQVAVHQPAEGGLPAASLLAATLAAMKEGAGDAEDKTAKPPASGLAPGKPIEKLPPPRPPVAEEDEYEDDEDDEDEDDLNHDEESEGKP